MTRFNFDPAPKQSEFQRWSWLERLRDKLTRFGATRAYVDEEIAKIPGGVTAHDDLTGRDNDDNHLQYSLVDGTRAFTGTVGGITPAADTDLTTKEYVDDVATGGGGGGLSAPYKFDRSTGASNPGDGEVRVNNSSFPAVTACYINTETEPGGDWSNVLRLLNPGDGIYIQETEDSSYNIRMQVSNTYTDNGSWLNIPVITLSNGSRIRDGNDVTVLLLIGGGEMSSFDVNVARGIISGISVVHKFGRNPDVDTGSDPEDIRRAGGNIVWQTTAQVIRCTSGSANDTFLGSGARTLVIQGLDANFELQEETVQLNGTGNVDTSNTYIRVFRAYVDTTGTYSGSNVGALTMTYLTTGDIAVVIGAGEGQTETTAYTVPAGKTAFVKNVTFGVTETGNRDADIVFLQRPNADDVTAPFRGAERVVLDFDGVHGVRNHLIAVPLKFEEKTDLWWRVNQVNQNNTSVSVNYEIILVDN